MKTRLIQIAALLLMLGGTSLANAAEAETSRQAQASVPATAQAPAQERDQLAWQRVGAPESLAG
ncbi:MAG: hypothetical protein PHR30_12965 [Gallionellaceae bacterium]|nr:hypothetical protein [Gallionellaceae bacterium]MDD5366243.1 hypothetical protein [Gallionellaceae bacterium]